MEEKNYSNYPDDVYFVIKHPLNPFTLKVYAEEWETKIKYMGFDELIEYIDGLSYKEGY